MNSITPNLSETKSSTWKSMVGRWHVLLLSFLDGLVWGAMLVPGSVVHLIIINIPGSSNCEKHVPFHQKKLSKGRHVSRLEDPGMIKSEFLKDGPLLFLEANFVSKLAHSTKWSHTVKVEKLSLNHHIYSNESQNIPNNSENRGALRATPWTNVAQHPRKLKTQQLSPLKLKKELQKLEKKSLSQWTLKSKVWTLFSLLNNM